MKHSFKPAWWLPGPHLQTLWPFLCRRKPSISIERERFELNDGDFIDLDWINYQEKNSPIVILLHGLEGSIHSSYARGMLKTIKACGWRGVLIHFRSCSGEMNRHSRMYHSGDTKDIEQVITSIRQREPQTLLTAIGYSLGGNVLLKWLGETGAHNPLTAAIAISVPFELGSACDKMNRGFARIYQRYFIQQLTKKIHKKFNSHLIPPSEKIRTMRTFDEWVTAPLHGFKNADDYYQKSSSRQFLSAIRIPTLLIHAKDDPLMIPEVIPTQEELPPTVQLELTMQGGHLGFVMGSVPWQAEYWLEKRIAMFMNQHL